jgi:pimeloyl-ACP methyl ester carboxylesterase
MSLLARREAGAAGAPTIVFLHASGTTGAMWDDEMTRLADRFHCLAPDLPGHGYSGEHPWRSLSATADRIAQLVLAQVSGERVHLVGLSLGGAVAYVFLARHPRLVERAVVDGAAIAPARVAPLMSAAVMLASPFLQRPLINRLMASALGVPPENRSAFRAGMRRVRPRTFSRAFHDAQNPGVLDEVLRCEVPTLLVAGEHELRDMHAANAALAALMPRADARIVRGVGHGWIATRPELHASVVRAWLEGSPLPGELRVETGGSRATPARRRFEQAAARSAGRPRLDGGDQSNEGIQSSRR